MRIAINTRFQGYSYQEGFGYFTRSLSQALIEQYPEDQFKLIFDGETGAPNPAANVTEIVLKPAARHPVIWKYWFDVKLPFLLKRLKADVFLSPDGFCSLRTNIPQVVVVHDLAYLHYPSFLPAAQQFYYKFYTPHFLRKAKKIITVSAFSKADIVRHFPFTRDKIEVVAISADSRFVPATEAIKERVKEKYTGGREYFLYVGSIHPRKNLIQLLKAFSSFKKRQQTNMQLVIAGRMAWKNEGFQTALSTFKFRDDVKLTGYLPIEDLVELMGSAYGVINPSLWEGFGLPVLEAMRCGVPVLCSGNSALTETGGDAAIYFDPLNADDITKQMALIFKDESLRAKMITKGLTQAAGFSWEKSGRRVREILSDAVKGGSIP
jgi:glycosyltransferase involved in cell wall biosynthesis